MTTCKNCSLVPQTLPSEGVLVLTGLPEREALALAEALQPYGIPLNPLAGGLWTFDLFAGGFEIVLDWSRLVSDRLLQEGGWLRLEPSETLSFAHLGKVRPLTDLVKRIKNAWVLDMVRENRFTVYYHPIVEAGSPELVYAHECLMRGLDHAGGIVSPGRILDAADEEGLVFHLDRVCRLNSIRGFAAQGVAGKAFINFNPVSVYNPVACLQSTVAAARSVGLTPDRIVFELIERNHVSDEAHLLRVVEFYRAAGYGVALDDVGAATRA